MGCELTGHEGPSGKEETVTAFGSETGFESREFGGIPEFGEFGGAHEFGEFGEFGEFPSHEAQEAQETEQFLGKILGGLFGESGSPLSESEEVELAAELLEITSEQELEQFLGGLFRRVGQAVGSFVRGPVGRALGGVLKGIAKTALPVVGGALGSFVAPGVGTALGSKLGMLASRLFEAEFEGMPQEQAEFEVARRLVGLSAAAARNAALARPRPGVTPQMLARAAVAQAARSYAPGVYRSLWHSLRATVPGRPGVPASRRPGPLVGYEPTYGSAGDPYATDGWEPDRRPSPYEEPTTESSGPGASGSWVRRGRRIVLFGV